MKSLIYLLYFMVGLPEFLSQDSEACYRQIFDGLDFPGNDFHQSVVEDEHSCQRKCTEEPHCQFFTFVKKEFHNEVQRYICYLKNNERGTPSRITFLLGVMSGFSLRKCGFNYTGCGHELAVNIDYPGNDIESVLAPDVHYCQKLCTERTNCQFFTYLTRDWNTDLRRFFCYLKNNPEGEPTVKTELQNVISGYSLKQCKAYNSCFKDLFVGLDFLGDDFRQFVVDDEHSCQRECTEQPDCQYFTFVNGLYHKAWQRYICYLKKSEGGTPSKITTLENVVSGFPLRECQFNKSVSECRTALSEDVDFPGNDIIWVLAPDVNVCQQLCTDHPQCLFFTFLKREWSTDHRRFYCYLKQTATGKVSRKTNLQNAVSGFSLKLCKNLVKFCNEKIFDGLDFPGNDFHQSVVEDEHSCQRKCTEEPHCQFFTFVKKEFHNEVQRYLCYLKNNGKGTPSRITVLSGVMSGFSLRNCEFNNPGCVYELAANIDFPGNDIESVLTPDVHYCQKLCTEYKNCQFFTYLTRNWNADQRRFYCYLKENMKGEPTIKTQLQNVVSGYSLKKCKSYNSCFKDLFVGLDFPGDDFRQFVVDDEHSCQRECTEKPDCQYFTFVNGLYRNARQRYICYLKKSEQGTPTKITTLENVVSGFPLRECEFNKSVSECRTDLSEDIDFPGNDITWVLAPDVNVCQQLCTDHPQCLFFTFVKREWSTDHRRFYCYLKQTSTGRVSRKTRLQNVVSGFSLKSCKNVTSSCFKDLFVGLDFPGDDFRQFLVEDEHSCQRECTEEPDCQYFTFVNGLYRNARQRYICYLKKSKQGTPSKITTLKNVASGFPLRECEFNKSVSECRTDLSENVDFPGNDITWVLAPDANVCQQICTDDPQCLFFTFLKKEWTTDHRRFYCYLKQTATGTVSRTTKLLNVVSGFSLKQCKNRNSTCYKKIFDGLDFPGNDFHQSVVEDEHSCQRKCTEEPHCQFFTFVKKEFHNEVQRYICYLKNNEKGTPSRITDLSGVMSGFSLRRCEFSNTGCVPELAVNTDFPGNDIESVLAPDVKYCQKLCTDHKNCQFFTYLASDWNTDKRRFYCYLKNNAKGEPSTVTKLQNAVSGYSLKKCKAYDSCFKDLFVGLDFPGDDFRQFVVDDEHSCQRECTEEPDCQYFTFVNGLYHNARQRYICYLKKSEQGTPSKITTLENVVSGFPLGECAFNKSVSECQRDLSEDIDFPGNDITWVLAPDVNVCQQLCTDHPQCLFFTFVKREWSTDHRRFYCYLKQTATGAVSRTTKLQNVVSGFSLKQCKNLISHCYEKFFDGIDFLGNDFRHSVVEDEHSCQRKCTEEPHCQFFTFVKKEFHNEVQRYTCYLKNNEKGTPSIITVVSNVMSGFPLRNCEFNNTGCVHELAVNTDFPGNDIESVLVPDVKYCQKLCTDHKNCQFFTYLTSDWNADKRRFYCYLKKNLEGEPTLKTDLQNVVSGYSLKQCRTYNSCFKDLFVGLDFPGDDFRQFVVDDEHSCQRECTEEPDCQYFTFANGLYRNARQRYICYLKKSEGGTPSKITTLENVVSGFPFRECRFNKTVSECRTAFSEDVDFPGNDITWLLAPDVNVCQQLCTDHPQCLFFTFVKREWSKDHRRFYCYLKQTATGTVSRTTKLLNVVSGFSLKQCRNLKSSCYVKIFDGLDFPGNDFHQSVVEDEHSCQRKCTEEPHCQFFTFVKKEFHNEVQRYICYLKNNEKGTPSRITVLTDVMSGFSLRRCEFNNTGCVHELAANIDFPGNDIESVLAPNVNYCQKLCTEHKNCQFFTYLTSDWNMDQRRFYCYLKRNEKGDPTLKTQLQNVISGYSLKLCNTHNSCFDDLSIGLDFPGDDFRQFVVDDEHSCQTECTEEPDCQYFTFVNGLYRNARQRYICYLKKSKQGTPSRITALENVVSGFPLRECGFNTLVSECRGDLSEDVDFPGNDITWVLAPDVSFCQKVCTYHPLCLFFTFLKREWSTDHRRFYCYLKETASGIPSRITPLQNVVSGYSLKWCHNLMSSCESDVYYDRSFEGKVLQVKHVESYGRCQESCTDHRRCQFFTLEETHDQKMHSCYLQSTNHGIPSKIDESVGAISGFSLRLCASNRTCGQVNGPEPHVHGGRVSLPGEWPWQISLHLKKKGKFRHSCGGSIISDHWIITAAHCFESAEKNKMWRIYAGITTLSDITNETPFYEIERIIIHENFNSDTEDCDIALLKLKQAIVFNDYQMPICLPASEKQVPSGSQCWVTGWGETKAGKTSQILLNTNVPVIDNERCQTYYSGSIITENMVCAGKGDEEVDTCKRDTGGPLACKHNGKWYLVGITSWGHGCGEEGRPEVYTRLSKLRGWVYKKVSEHHQ
ncbi:uncharacterized protein [Hemitrygon akajei]|uniref:uncharacterized protein isoform X1 n=1 Tax=Hemitrygon akajei TaxID=2704970 RepID=UPI003BF9DF5B